MVEQILIGIAVGLAIGVFSGMLGIGGGTIMVPVFRLAMGLSAIASTATSLFTIIPTSIAGAITHFRNKTCIPKLGLALGFGGAITSPIGVWLAQIAPDWAVMLAAACVIAYSASTMLRKAIALGKKGDSPAAKPASGKDASTPSRPKLKFELNGRNLALAFLIGAAAGGISGFVGVGGGFIMVPLMLGVLDMPMKQASGTSLIAIMILAAPATIMQCALGNVNYLIGVSVACGSIPGAILGAKLMSRVPERALRFTFAGFLGIASILLIVNELGLLG